MKRLNFSRPVLVPVGLVEYEEPEEVSPGVFALAPNLGRIARLLGTGKNEVERRAIQAMYDYVLAEVSAWVSE